MGQPAHDFPFISQPVSELEPELIERLSKELGEDLKAWTSLAIAGEDFVATPEVVFQDSGAWEYDANDPIGLLSWERRGTGRPGRYRISAHIEIFDVGTITLGGSGDTTSGLDQGRLGVSNATGAYAGRPLPNTVYLSQRNPHRWSTDP